MKNSVERKINNIPVYILSTVKNPFKREILYSWSFNPLGQNGKYISRI
jgi:hypothetical protein